MTDTVEAYEELDGVVAGMVDRVLSCENVSDLIMSALASTSAVLDVHPFGIVPSDDLVTFARRITSAAEQRTWQLLNRDGGETDRREHVSSVLGDIVDKHTTVTGLLRVVRQ